MVVHLSRILSELSHHIQVHDTFPDEQLFEISKKESPWTQILSTTYPAVKLSLNGPSKCPIHQEESVVL